MITIEQEQQGLELPLSDAQLAEANDLLLRIITHPRHPVATLRLMSDTRILHRFLPEWAPISGLMQFNRYHHYTVDAHTLRALEWMHVLLYGQPDKLVGQPDLTKRGRCIAWAK